jgi:ferric-dicitrate binding protein FerR (iron transport regulator)
MALQLGALREALIDAGASPEKAKAAAEEAASYETRLASIDAKLTIALWAGGLLFAAILASQALMWNAIGKVDGHLDQIATQVGHIEQLVVAQGSH